MASICFSACKGVDRLRKRLLKAFQGEDRSWDLSILTDRHCHYTFTHFSKGSVSAFSYHSTHSLHPRDHCAQGRKPLHLNRFTDRSMRTAPQDGSMRAAPEDRCMRAAPEDGSTPPQLLYKTAPHQTVRPNRSTHKKSPTEEGLHNNGPIRTSTRHCRRPAPPKPFYLHPLAALSRAKECGAGNRRTGVGLLQAFHPPASPPARPPPARPSSPARALRRRRQWVLQPPARGATGARASFSRARHRAGPGRAGGQCVKAV